VNTLIHRTSHHQAIHPLISEAVHMNKVSHRNWRIRLKCTASDSTAAASELCDHDIEDLYKSDFVLGAVLKVRD